MALEPAPGSAKPHHEDETIVVSGLTKAVVRRPCTFMWAILAITLILTFAVIGSAVRGAKGFLDVLCARRVAGLRRRGRAPPSRLLKPVSLNR